MNNRRTIGWMILVLLVLVALHLFLNARGGRADARLVKRSFLARSADRATEFRLIHSDAQEVRLVRSDIGWRIVEPFSGSADSQKIMQLADALAFCPVEDSQSDSDLLRLGRTRADYGLEAPALSVAVVNGGDVQDVISFGEMTPSKDGVYVSVEGMDLVSVVSTNVLTLADLPASGFRFRRLFLSDAEVGTLDVRRGFGPFLRLSQTNGKWQMEEPHRATASTRRVEAFLAELFSIEAQEFIWPLGTTNEPARATVALLAGYGLDSESAITLTLRGLDGVDRSISLGKDAGDNRVYALVQNGEAIVTVDAHLKDLALAESRTFLDSRLFPYEAKAISMISISEGSTGCSLARAPNGLWRMDSPISAPVNQEIADELLARLLDLDARDVETNGVKVCLSTNAEPISVARERIFANHRLADLRSRDVVRIDGSEVVRVVSSIRGMKPTSVVWDADRRAWNVESSVRPGVADEKAIADLLALLNPLRAISVVKLKVLPSELAAYGLETPQFVVSVDFRRDDSVRRNVLIGDRTANGYYAMPGSLDAVFVIPWETVERLTAPLVTPQGIEP